MSPAAHLVLIAYCAIMGAWTASFVGCAAYRIPRGQKLEGRSYCEGCGIRLSFELVPVLGWLLLAGRCRTCKANVPVIYPLSEALLAAVFVANYLYWGLSLPWLAACAAGSCTLYVALCAGYFKSRFPWRVAVVALVLTIYAGSGF